jgi:hypothetical protein
MQHDYIKRQVKDFANVLAYLLGLAKREELAAVMVEIDGILQNELGLQPNFKTQHLMELYEAGKLDYEGVKQLVALLKLRAEVLQTEDPAEAERSRLKALEVIQQLEERSGVFDFEMAEWKRGLWHIGAFKQ